jgi:hypothetical protein
LSSSLERPIEYLSHALAHVLQVYGSATVSNSVGGMIVSDSHLESIRVLWDKNMDQVTRAIGPVYISLIERLINRVHALLSGASNLQQLLNLVRGPAVRQRS